MSKTDNPDHISEIVYCNNHAQFALDRVEQFFMTGLFCDVTLVVGTKRIDAHRVVLCAMSEYFLTMFTTLVGESKKYVIEMKNVDPEALAAVINSFYSSKLKLSMETVDEVIAIAHYLLLTEIFDVCCNFLKEHLTPSNSLSIQMLANRYERPSLIHVTTVYIEEHFMEIIQNQDFLELSKSQISVLLSSDFINVPSEENAFQAFILWLNHDLECREKYTTELLALIKLPNISPKFLIDHIKVHPLIKDNITCQKLISEAMVCQLLPNKLSDSQTTWNTRRKSGSEGFYIIGGLHAWEEFALTVDQYNFRYNTWTSVSTMKKNWHFGMTVLDNKIYVLGGSNNFTSIFNSLNCYNPQKKLWTSLATMPNARRFVGAAALNGNIYALGGLQHRVYLNTVDRWNSATGNWDSISPMNSGRQNGCFAVVDERLYVIGGGNGDVECYDPCNDHWTVVSTFNALCDGMAVVAAKGFLYVIGGIPQYSEIKRKHNTVNRFDPVSNTWVYLKPLLVGCGFASVGLFQDKIFVAGGVDEKGNYLKLLQVYDIQLDEWEFLGPLSIGRARGIGAVIMSP